MVCMAGRVTLGSHPELMGKSSTGSVLVTGAQGELSKMYSARQPSGVPILCTLVRWSPSSLMNSSCWSKWHVSGKWHASGRARLREVARLWEVAQVGTLLGGQVVQVEQALAGRSSPGAGRPVWLGGPLPLVSDILMSRKEMRPPRWFCRNIRLSVVSLCPWERSRKKLEKCCAGPCPGGGAGSRPWPGT